MKKAFMIPLLALLAGCGGDDATGPTPTNVPSVAGTYYGNWLVQFRRFHDGYSGSFYCSGNVTLVQSPGGVLTGFSVVGTDCPPNSFDLTGTVQADGAVAFSTGAPRPPVGQCPAANVSYTGLVADRVLSARATTELNCPGPGEGLHRFDYILTGYKNS